MHARRPVRAALVALATLVTVGALPAHAQVVRGQIVDGSSQAPIPGAFVVLLDSAGKQRGGALSGEGGTFALKAPHAGHYRLKAERIGYADALSEPLDMVDGRTLTYRFEIAVKPVDLEGLKVTGKGRCRLSRDVGAATTVLWDEVSKALSIAVWGDEERGVPFQTRVWARARSLSSREIQDDTVEVVSGYARSPFTIESVRVLAAKGFIQAQPDGSDMFYGLDAKTLLSDDFLATHCFRVEEAGKDQNGLIGLGFQPLHRGGPPDITGTLWVDRASSELRYLEFRYDRIPNARNLSTREFGGRVYFRRLDNGDWVVDRWWLRMPHSVTVSRGRKVIGRGLRIREQGGEIRFIGTAAGPGADGRSTLSGTVYDSTRSLPLAHANVFLTDINRVTTTDSTGRFDFEHLPAGTHEVAFTHSYADFLGLPVTARPVVVGPDRHASVTLSVPRAAGCPMDTMTGGVLGFVEDSESGDPLPGAVVHASWSIPGRKGRTPTSPGSGTHETPSDAYGRYLLCDLPLGTEIDLAAQGGAVATLELGAPGMVWQQLLVRPRR